MSNTLKADQRKPTAGMTHNKKKGKYIIQKDGVYFSLTNEQVYELYDLLTEIIRGDL